MKINLKNINSQKLKIYYDKRGYFYEVYNIHRNKKKFIQTNISYSKQNVIRGLHYQCKQKQSQLVTIIEGEINYIVVDIMPKSKHFKKYRKYKLSSKYNNQIYVPGGFANGFEVISKHALIHYNVDKTYNTNDDFGIIYNDNDLDIKWSVKKPLLSDKDLKNPLLKNISQKNLPK